MSSRRNVLLEIAGQSVGFTASGVVGVGAAASWSTSYLEAITNIPRSQGAKIDPFTGGFDSQGSSVGLNQLAAYLYQRKNINTATLDSDLNDTETTALVASPTTAFPASGTVYVGDEAIQYSSKTVASFLGLTRGSFGTTARTWTSEIDSRTGDKRKVYEDNPFFEGRKCVITWFDPDGGGDHTVRFTGYVSNPRFGDNAFSIDVINGKKLLEDAEVMGGRYAKGVLAGAFVARTNVNNYQNYISSKHNGIMLDLEDEDFPFSIPAGPTALFYFQIDEEIVGFANTEVPALTGTVGAVGIGTPGKYFESDADFAIGDWVKYVSLLVEHNVTITFIEAGAGGTDRTFRCFHNGATNPIAGDTVETTGKQKLSILLPGQLRTEMATHAIGAQVKEVRILEGDHVDLVLQMLLSTGTGNNGIYDVLPKSYGAGIDQTLIDVYAFDKIRDYSDARRMIFDGPVKIQEMLATLARVTATRIFWNRFGNLTVNAERDVYPDSASQLTIGSSNLRMTSIPSWSTPLANIRNSWVIRGNSPRGKDFVDTIMFEDPESIQFYGKRGLPDLEDAGLLLAQAANKFELIGRAILTRWSRPCIELAVDLIFDESIVIEPGQLVSVVIPHLPNLTGSTGLASELFEVVEVFPQDDAGSIAVVAFQMPPAAATRLIGPAGEISALDVGLKEITIKSTAFTHYAPTITGASNILPLAANGEDGREDVQYFDVDHRVRIFDASTLGAATPNDHQAIITARSYLFPFFTLTLDSLPAWTIASGDIIVYDWYPAVNPVSPGLIGDYAWLASGTPPLLFGTDTPHVWGL